MGRYRFSGRWYTSERMVGPNDGRRHKSRCKYVAYYNKHYYCSLYGERCYGSEHCNGYTERGTLTYTKVDIYEKMNNLRIGVPSYYPMSKKIRTPGTMVKHKIFGFGTVKDYRDDILVVDFFKNGEKRQVRLCLDFCLKNNIISVYEYGR